jgi:hypothetical protein
MAVFRRRRGHPYGIVFNAVAGAGYFTNDALTNAYFFDDALTLRYATSD